MFQIIGNNNGRHTENKSVSYLGSLLLVFRYYYCSSCYKMHSKDSLHSIFDNIHKSL